MAGRAYFGGQSVRKRMFRFGRAKNTKRIRSVPKHAFPYRRTPHTWSERVFKTVLLDNYTIARPGNLYSSVLASFFL